ncbi:MAG: ABC transporter ATP-binding protein [Candidatus Limnocylindrales bacterium]
MNLATYHGANGAVVEFIGVHKVYGRTEALRGLDFTIEPGELVAILGPNGAGKTTAISCMLGLRHATAGTVRLFGLPPADRAARSRRGVMLQESGVPGQLTVRELVELFRSYYAAPLDASAAIGLAGLDAQARTAAAKLSGGQRQRLYFALAVCGDPDALFLDEPTAAMDVASRRAFLETIRSFSRAGKTIVLTTHDMDEADQLARRVVVIDRGRLVADDTPAAIKARVAGKRVSFRSLDPLDAAAFAGLPVCGLVLDGERPAGAEDEAPGDSGRLVRFLSTEPEAALSALFARSVRVRDLEVVGADLEEAFLSLTGEREVRQ